MRFATDTGGTFTDLVVEDDDGTITLHKAPTTPSDPVAGVLDALRVAADARGLTLAGMLARGDSFIHGTTHAINAIIQGRTARTALIVTTGHRDMLLFREGGRTEPFNHAHAYPQPYVPRALTFEVPERIMAGGHVVTALDEAATAQVLDAIARADVEAIAVALLWSTVNPVHENRIGEMIAARFPDMPYSLSHSVNPTLREFRRASSAAIDASLKPLMGAYLGSLEARLADAGFAGRVMVLTSAGGMVDAREVAAQPISAINSGPSMAPVAGRHYARREGGFDSAIIADTGGTTYDISIIADGRVAMTRDLWIGEPYRGHLAGYPSVEVKSVGAGGGSIARVDASGLLHVGPQSAGAMPGPVCYQRGGTLPTVTDACVVLGYLDPDFFLGGKMKLDALGARRAIEAHIAAPLGVSLEEAAWSIVDLATEAMVQAIQDLVVNQGIDPARAVLIGGGGAAGLNSTFIARRLGCPRLLIPETGAAMSAAGAMMSDITAEFAATVYSNTARFDSDAVSASVAGLAARAEDFIARSGRPGGTQFIAEARYEGQAWEIDVPLPKADFSSPGAIAEFRARFEAEHLRLFTIVDPASEIELIGLRARVQCSARDGESDFKLMMEQTDASPRGSRSVYFAGAGRVETPVWRLDALAPDRMFDGPALIESDFTTIVVDPAARFWRSAPGAILIEERPL
ncbi:hydantoinase/oxoprolinase family protein [Sphingosinicella soli]|uniref:N-methylhydantoinase A n=1 Tax=Sphingosinicella soli TaxID=333708 RepID=A0A7W7B218_9SPHN|nr:hydantoinase/oxoprolinase family protein [Sphingosinicella soli]MBB4631592.1 N-methylhydantoinase A [Sphingosinicella soli]